MGAPSTDTPPVIITITFVPILAQLYAALSLFKAILLTQKFVFLETQDVRVVLVDHLHYTVQITNIVRVHPAVDVVRGYPNLRHYSIDAG